MFKAIFFIVLLVFSSCTPIYTPPEYEEPAGYTPPEYKDPWAGYTKNPTVEQYNDLLDKLELKTSISKTVINEVLEEMKIAQNYEYSFYSGSSSEAYTLIWKYWSSYTSSFIYYKKISIWADKETKLLKKDMCSYYEG